MNPCIPDDRYYHVGKNKAQDAGNLLLLKAITLLDIGTVSEFSVIPKQ